MGKWGLFIPPQISKSKQIYRVIFFYFPSFSKNKVFGLKFNSLIFLFIEFCGVSSLCDMTNVAMDV